MMNISERVSQFLMLGLLVITIALSVGHLTTMAQTDPPNCSGLPCTEQQDCGTSCFCNRPNQQCIAN